MVQHAPHVPHVGRLVRVLPTITAYEIAAAVFGIRGILGTFLAQYGSRCTWHGATIDASGWSLAQMATTVG